MSRKSQESLSLLNATEDVPVFPDVSKLTVVKREGTIVPFQEERIRKAIEQAFRAVRNIDVTTELSESLNNTVLRLSSLVVGKAHELGEKGVALSVEGIQDLVEITLMKNGYHDVARHYIIYRNQRQAKRSLVPQNTLILRKDRSTRVRFKPTKVASTIEHIFRIVHDVTDTPLEPSHIQLVNSITRAILERIVTPPTEDTLWSLHDLQDIVEEELMRASCFQEAKAYILERKQRDTQEEKELHTAAKKPPTKAEQENTFTVLSADGATHTISTADIKQRIQFAARGWEKNVSVDALLEQTAQNFYQRMKIEDIDKALIMASRAKIEEDPDYAFVTARFLLDQLYRETMEISALDPQLEKTHRKYFKQYIQRGISLERLNPKLLDFDLERLGNHMKLERDDLFSYLGLQTLYDRYFIHEQERRLETPQIFYMRVAMGLSINEPNKNDMAITFYDILSQFLYSPGTPTLFNSGTTHSQLSSCYLSTVEDDLEHIFKVISDDAQLSKWAGGLGNDWSNVRATGSYIKGTNGKSQGIIPFLKVANDTAVAVNQGGKRKGAMCAYLETWHLDIEDFIELRKNTGDDRRRTHDMNTANWIPDLFIKRVQQDAEWTLFSPSDTPDLHDLYGKAFEVRYTEYEKMADDGKLKLFKRISATELWRKMLGMLFETGHPWITFKDPSNIRSPQDHVGVVHSSNLCTEILLNTNRNEVAVCNLGSINLVKHMKGNKLDESKLANTVRWAVRMLDNVIDINFYPIPEARNANMRHRAVGLGLMGFQDALYMQNIAYASHEAVAFSDECQELISYYAILASSELAKERSTYESYKGSKWDRGLLPIDTIDILEQERGVAIEMDRSMKKDWSKVRKSIKKHGMRNSLTMAIAPTATIANILGVTQSIEPTYKNLYVKSNLSGEFTVPNPHLIAKLKKLGLWDPEMLDDLKYYEGSLQEIDRIPEEVKSLFLTAFELEPEWLIECASRRQKWLDMGQSLNLYLAEPNGKKLHNMYMASWNKGLKTNYYLRGKAATSAEMASIDINKREIQPRWMKSKSASSNIAVQRKTSCSMEDGCESCQ